MYGYAIDNPVIEKTPSIDQNSRTTSSFSIIWTNEQKDSTTSPPLIGYEVYIRDLNETFLEYKVVYNGKYIDNVFSTTVNGLINGHYYGIVYYAYNKAGKSNMSPELIVLCGVKPSPPKEIKLNSVSSSSIVISWEYSDLLNSNLVLIKGFYIYNEGQNNSITCQYESNGSGSTENNMIPSKYNTCTITTSNGDTYNLRISALNEIGESEKSNNVLKVKAIDLPSKPTLSLKYFDKDYCELSWTSNYDSGNQQKKYILYYEQNNNDNSNNLIKLYEGNINTYKHENLSTYVTYIYFVSEVNDGGESEKAEIECTTYPIPLPPDQMNIIES